MEIQGPDFVALMKCPDCEGDDCILCEEPVFTPRTVQALFTAFNVRADDGYDDIEAYGDGPLEIGRCALLDEYPQFTWGCDALWRRMAVRSFDDLAADMIAGVRPQARCPSEEVAVLLAARWAAALVGDDPEVLGVQDHLATDSDYQWDMVLEELLQDLDVEWLWVPSWDGVEDPGSELNDRIRLGDYRPQAWFDTDGLFPQRDPGRGFRRTGGIPQARQA